MQVETTQVRLRLISDKFHKETETGEIVTGKDIKKQMKLNRVWKNDEHGAYASIMYDGHEFRFREGKALTIGLSVANSLLRSSAIIVGSDQLNGPYMPFLEKVDTFEIGEEKDQMTPTTCPVCKIEQDTLPRLVRHLDRHRKDHPELFTKQEAPEEAVDKGESSDGAEDFESVGDERA